MARVGTFFRLGTAARRTSEFTVTGSWKARDGWQAFEKAVEADNEDVAEERVYAEFGSRHGLKRTQVEITEVSA